MSATLVPDVALSSLRVSPLNPRKTRDPKHVAEIAALIAKWGFDPTCAPRAYAVRGGHEVFAGGTRVLAAIEAGLESVPLYVYPCSTDEERARVWRLAYIDNEQAGAHRSASPVDVWADYAQRRDEGWTQQQMAEALGVDKSLVAKRLTLNEFPDRVKRFCGDGKLEEGHITPIIPLVVTSPHLTPWLTTDQARVELVEDVLSKHRGGSEGAKPSVKVFREAAKRWKAMIAAAEGALEGLGDFAQVFVDQLVYREARTQADVERAKSVALAAKQAEADRKAAELAAEQERISDEQLAIEREQARLAAIERYTKKVAHGDAVELVACMTSPARLVLTDPPYGEDFQSKRRKVSRSRKKVANDEDPEFAAGLLEEVLSAVKVTEDATALVFTGWRHEPLFRAAAERAGWTLKGSLVWVKKNHGTGDLKGSFAPKHERILHLTKGSPELVKRVPDVLAGSDKQNSAHPTEKPLDLLTSLIEATTEPGALVVDPFAGSGNTLFAALAAGRGAWGCELDATYYRDITDRLHAMAEESLGG